jgi:anti-sigma B factor antagonist
MTPGQHRAAWAVSRVRGITAEFTASTDVLPRGGRLVHIHGAVDLYAASDLKGILHEAVEQGAGRLAVDLTDSTLLDSSALSALLSAHRRAELLDGRIVLVNTDPDIAQLLAISGLDGIVGVAASTAEACELLSA